MLGLSAEEFGTVLFAAALAITTFLGGKKGKEVLTKKPAAQPEMIEVAGAIVSDKAVDRMVKSLDAFSSAAVLMTAAIERDVDAKSKLTASLNRNSDVSEDMRDEIKDTGRKLERMKDELIRVQIKP